MPVRARQHIKLMRGGANAHLMLADDDRYYVVKFRNNPQHPRILVNELICYVLLRYLQLPTPDWELVEVSGQLIMMTPELTLQQGKKTVACEPGLHFGSLFPGDPSRRAVYDYIPSSLLELVYNVGSFRGMLAFDKWVSNANGRQAIFYRDRAKDWISTGPSGGGIAAAAGERKVSPRSLIYVVSMIDHGFAFTAQKWEFVDEVERGIYRRREVYRDVRGYDDFEPFLERIRNCPQEIFDDAWKKTPPEWYDGDWDAVESLLEGLYRRRNVVADLIWKAKESARDPFPNWNRAFSAGGTG